jgi:hypothetical protein
MSGEVLADDDVVTPSDIASSPYYSEFLPRIGIKWWMGAGFNSGENFYCLVVQSGRSSEAFTLEDKAVFGTIRPQLNHLGRLLDVTRKSLVGSALSVLKGLSEAAICIGTDGKVIDANPSPRSCSTIGLACALGKYSFRTHFPARILQQR